MYTLTKEQKKAVEMIGRLGTRCAIYNRYIDRIANELKMSRRSRENIQSTMDAIQIKREGMLDLIESLGWLDSDAMDAFMEAINDVSEREWSAFEGFINTESVPLIRRYGVILHWVQSDPWETWTPDELMVIEDSAKA